MISAMLKTVKKILQKKHMYFSKFCFGIDYVCLEKQWQYFLLNLFFEVRVHNKLDVLFLNQDGRVQSQTNFLTNLKKESMYNMIFYDEIAFVRKMSCRIAKYKIISMMTVLKLTLI